MNDFLKSFLPVHILQDPTAPHLPAHPLKKSKQQKTKVNKKDQEIALQVGTVWDPFSGQHRASHRASAWHPRGGSWDQGGGLKWNPRICDAERASQRLTPHKREIPKSITVGRDKHMIIDRKMSVVIAVGEPDDSCCTDQLDLLPSIKWLLHESSEMAY